MNNLSIHHMVGAVVKRGYSRAQYSENGYIWLKTNDLNVEGQESHAVVQGFCVI